MLILNDLFTILDFVALFIQNKYACDVCRAYTEAVRSTQYQQLPPILNVHLKRFSASMGNGYGNSVFDALRDECVH